MKPSTSILRVFFLCLILCFGVTWAQSDTEVVDKANYNIIFGSYRAGKEKWRGPFHNKLLFPWFNTATFASDEKEYGQLINSQRKNGVKFIGYYYSATTSYPSEIIPDHRKFPEVSIPPKAIKLSWIIRDTKNQPATWPDQKNRFFLDVGRKEVQDAMLNRAVGNARRLGCNVLFLDNWYHKYWSPRDITVSDWTEKCLSLLVRARELTRQHNMKLVVNTSSPPANWSGFVHYVDGIAYELGAHPVRVERRDLYEQELSSYEKAMKQGKSVFLYTDRLTHNGKRWDEDGRKVAATAILVMPEEQRHWGGIYVHPPRYEIWPVGGWPMWPEQLGDPLGPRQWDVNTVTRKFERGSISVTVGKYPTFNIHMEY